jgi:hypothetical protein
MRMKKLLVLGLVAVMASVALAQSSEENMMGLFFSDTEFTDETTNHINTFAPFNGYVVLLNPTVETVGGYELGISFTDPAPFVLSVTGPNDWTNFGSPTNHIVGYQVPVPVEGDGVVLATVNMLQTSAALTEISFGPSTPSSFNGEGPGIADGENTDLLYLAPLTTPDGVVATVDGDGVTATEGRSLSSVKALFN